MPNRASAVLALFAITALSGCQQTDKPDRPPKPWVRGEGKVYEITSAGETVLALQVNDENHLEVVSLDPDTGDVLHRRTVERARNQNSKSAQGFPMLIAGSAIAYSDSTLSALDPATFEHRWSYDGPLAWVFDCHPNVCAADLEGTIHVLDGNTGKQLWTTEKKVYWINGLIELAHHEQPPHATMRRVRPDSGKAKPGWVIHPRKSYHKSAGYTFASAPNGTILTQAVDSDANVLGTDVYDAETGNKLWGRKLDVRYFIGTYIGFDKRHRTVHFLDPKTGEDRWSAHAPEGHVFDTEAPLAVDSKGRVWLALREVAGEGVTFVPVRAGKQKLGTLDRSRHTVVFARTPKDRSLTVKSGGTSREIDSANLFRPVDSGTGKVTAMPADLEVPKVLAPTEARQFRDRYVVGKDGHAIIARR